MNLNILQDIVENGRAWHPAIHGVERVRCDLTTEQQQQFHNWNFPHIQAHWGTARGPCRAHLRIILLRWYLSMCYAPVPHGLPLGASPLEHVLNELLLPGAPGIVAEVWLVTAAPAAWRGGHRRRDTRHRHLCLHSTERPGVCEVACRNIFQNQEIKW